jgi:hypothetical protein
LVLSAATKSRTSALDRSSRSACHSGLRPGRLTAAAFSAAPSLAARDHLPAALKAAFAFGQAEVAQFALQALQRLVGLEGRGRKAVAHANHRLRRL